MCNGVLPSLGARGISRIWRKRGWKLIRQCVAQACVSPNIIQSDWDELARRRAAKVFPLYEYRRSAFDFGAKKITDIKCLSEGYRLPALHPALAFHSTLEYRINFSRCLHCSILTVFCEHNYRYTGLLTKLAP